MKEKVRVLIGLHIILMIYSLSGVCSKYAGSQPFLSLRFCIFYGMVIALLGGYAIGWQQVIKRISLTLAFANKAVTVIWGNIWGIIFFQENITFGKIIGAFLVMVGVITYAKAEEGSESEING